MDAGWFGGFFKNNVSSSDAGFEIFEINKCTVNSDIVHSMYIQQVLLVMSRYFSKIQINPFNHNAFYDHNVRFYMTCH